MKGAWSIFRRDIAQATKNTMAVVVVVGLAILPSLFTWFNVIASWDPLKNTQGLTVAVANSDEGYKSDLIPIQINIGDQVVSALRANEDLDWVVTSEDAAIDGTKSGKFYAAIVLPASFSQDMLTFYADGGTRTAIDYYTNEKKNSLAPKITGQGASTLSAQINTVFTQTISEIAVGILSDLSEYLNSADTKVLLSQLQAQVGQTSTQLRSASTNIGAFSSIVGSSQGLVTSAANLVKGTSAALNDSSAAVGGAVSSVGTVKSTIDSVADGLSDALASSVASYESLGKQVDAAFSAAQNSVEAQAGVLDALSDRVQAQIDAYEELRATLVDDVAPALPDGALDPVLAILDGAVSRQEAVTDGLDNAAAALRSGVANSQDTHDALNDAISQAKQSVTDLSDEYTNNLKGSLQDLASTLNTALTSIAGIGDDANSAVDKLSGAGDSINDKLSSAQDVMTQLQDKLDDAASTFDSVSDALEAASSSGDLSQLEQIVGANPDTLAASLASPIGLERTAVFPVANFGSSMAPLYSVLAFWVGALLMSVGIKVSVANTDVPGGEKLTSNQKFFGRYGIFAAMGLAQSTLLGLGNLFFVGVQAVHPWLYMLAGWTTSLVFTFLIYTLVVAFGSAGKAVGVFFLVIQISGAGAAYPLQLLPEWFQHISKFLPATYAVEAYRSAIAGIYHADFWKALGFLVLFVIPALILGLYLRKPLVGFNRRTAEALESTKVMG